jgi:hypothetical protein
MEYAAKNGSPNTSLYATEGHVGNSSAVMRTFLSRVSSHHMVYVNYKMFALCGISAPLLYTFAVAVGGILTPNYNYVSQAISELIASGAPEKALVDPLFGAYNLLVILFAIGLYHNC